MLSDAEIKEMESKSRIEYEDFASLLATTKEQRREITEQRELLNQATEYMRHAPTCGEYYGCDCGYDELQKQIEEKVKS